MRDATPQVIRTPPNTMVILLVPTLGMKTNTVTKVPRTFPIVETPYTAPVMRPPYSSSLSNSLTKKGESAARSATGRKVRATAATMVPQKS